MISMLTKILNKLGLSLNSDNQKLKAQVKELQELQVVKFSSTRLYKWGIKIKKNNKCDICSSTTQLEAHHIYPKSIHPTLAYEKSNGVCLCKKHHKKLHKNFPHNEFCNPIQYQIFKNMQLGEIAELEYTSHNLNIKNIFNMRKLTEEKDKIEENIKS